MERLKRDILKFLDNSRVISPENKQWWANFFTNEKKTYCNAEQVDASQKSWLLDDLRAMKFGRPTASDDETVSGTEPNHDNEQSPSIMPEVNVSSEVTDLVQSQFNNLPQVSTTMPL